MLPPHSPLKSNNADVDWHYTYCSFVCFGGSKPPPYGARDAERPIEEVDFSILDPKRKISARNLEFEPLHEPPPRKRFNDLPIGLNPTYER